MEVGNKLLLMYVRTFLRRMVEDAKRLFGIDSWRSLNSMPAKTGSDGALIFNAYQKTDAEDMVTSIEGADAEGVSIVAVAVDGEEAVKAIVK